MNPGRIARAGNDAPLPFLKRLPVLAIESRLRSLNLWEQPLHIILRVEMRKNLDIVHLSFPDLKGQKIAAGRRAALASSCNVRTQPWRRRRTTQSVVTSEKLHKLPNLTTARQVFNKQDRGIDLASNLTDLCSTRAHFLLHPKGVRFEMSQPAKA